jgi:hypothetical protein
LLSLKECSLEYTREGRKLKVQKKEATGQEGLLRANGLACNKIVRGGEEERRFPS